MLSAAAAGKSSAAASHAVRRVGHTSILHWRPVRGGAAVGDVRDQRRPCSLSVSIWRSRQCTLVDKHPSGLGASCAAQARIIATERLFSTTFANLAGSSRFDVVGSRDEAIVAPLVELYDSKGNPMGRRLTKEALARMSRDRFTLVITETVGGDRVVPTARVFLKQEYLAQMRDREKQEKMLRKLQPKEKILTIHPTCELVDVAHKAKRMRASLVKGDYVRVVIEQPKHKVGKTFKRGVKDPYTLAGPIWEALQKDWSELAKKGPTTSRPNGAQEAVFKPLALKAELSKPNTEE